MKRIMNWTGRRVLPICLLVCLSLPLSAQTDTAMVYTQERPLIYEDVWDLWPYSFLNDKGEPDGFNVDLIKLLMKELNIPYVIKMKPSAEAFRDLKEGRSDLMLGLAVGFHNEFGKYSKNAVTLFTQSVVTPKSQEVAIKNFHDLSNHKVIVNDSSLCHHLMMDYGWAANAQPVDDMREAIQQVSATEKGQIVWNMLSLKWLMRRYHIDNLELTPVNMPHGEYKFMSNDQHLLDVLDDTYASLYSAEKLTPIQNKWFYPDKQEKEIPAWVWYLVGAGLLLGVIATVYSISYNYQARRLTRSNEKRNKRLALILQTSHVRIWTYDIREKMFSWRNDNGQVAYKYTREEFAQRYAPEDLPRLKAAIAKLASLEKPEEEEEEVVLNLRAKDVEGGDTEDRDYLIVLSVLERDKSGKPTVIIGTKKDVTEERKLQRLADERAMRYWAIFDTSLAGIMLFDRDGYLTNINPRACELYQCDRDEMIKGHVHLEDVLDTGNRNLDELDNYHATQLVNIDRIPAEERKVPAVKRTGILRNEFRLMTVYDDSHELLGIFAVCTDVTSVVDGQQAEQQQSAQLQQTQKILAEYDADIDGVLHESDVRLATYSPKSHILTIHRSVNEVQHALTQTRCMTLVDDRSKKIAMRALNDMDDGEDKTVEMNIRTTLRTPDRHQLCLRFSFMPLHDKQGNVSEYVGLCRDMSELRDVERRMAIETAKVQEVENTKNSFVKNMVQEIRTPMDKVIQYVNQLDPEQPTASEMALNAGILENADYLLHLIDNILYLSRLEAHMVEFVKQPRNFAELFESYCAQGWEKYTNNQTRYIVENPYEQLVIDIDADALGHAIAQLTANAAQHTHKGAVRARYDYIGRQLTIYVDDTGEGIPADVLTRINERSSGNAPDNKGLGLAISKEIVRQMGGNLEINSEVGSGTTVYITIPCHAETIRRRRMIYNI